MLYVYIYIHIYMYISIVSSLCFFTPVFRCTGISYPPVLGFFGTTSDQGFQLHRLHCCWQTVRSWYCGTENLVVSPTGWKHHTRSKRISNFNIPTYQLVQRDKSSLHQVEHEWLHCIFFFTATPEISCARADSSRHIRGNGMVNFLHCDLLSQDVLRQSEQVLILSRIYVPLKKS